MRSTLFAVAVLMTFAAPAWPAATEASIAELRRSFTLDQRPVPPEVFTDFANGDPFEGARSAMVTVDVGTAIGSNLYADPIVRGEDGWVSQRKIVAGRVEPPAAQSYKFIGATQNGLLVVVSAYYGGGTGRYFTLHILDLAAAPAYDSGGKLYDRLNLTILRALPLGDRWHGSVVIAGNTVTIATDPGEPNNGNRDRTTQRLEAVRPR